jgi:hypothetical protein
MTKYVWIVEYEYEGNWCWSWSEIGFAFPSRRLAFDAASKYKISSGLPTRVRKFVASLNA